MASEIVIRTEQKQHPAARQQTHLEILGVGSQSSFVQPIDIMPLLLLLLIERGE